MTALELYNGTLIELNKLNAPTFTVEQFNYFANKSIQAYCDKRYNFYAVNQQLTDDLRVLLSTYTVPSDDLSNTGLTVLSLIKSGVITQDTSFIKGVVTDPDLIDQVIVGDQVFFEGDNRLRLVTEVDLTESSFFFEPHIETESGGGDMNPASVLALSTIKSISTGVEIYKSNQIFNPKDTLSDNLVLSYDLTNANYYHALAVRTYWEGTKVDVSGTSCSGTNAVRKMYPAKRLTYDMLTNIENNAYLKPMYRQPYYLLQDNLLNTGTDQQDLEDLTYYQNTPRVEIHMGQKVTGIDLISVEVDYLKLPEVMVLTEEEVYSNPTDTSQVLEWPDYLNSELISNLVSYFIENVSNPRIQTFPMLQQDTPQVPLEMGGQ